MCLYNTRRDVVFLSLSTLTGYIEIGFLFLGYKLGFSALQIATLGLIYQIGSLVPNPCHLGKLWIGWVSILGISSCLLSIYCPAKEGVFALACLSNSTITMILQALRAQYSGQTTDFKKRIFRIVGFSWAPFFFLSSTLVIAIALLVLVAITPWKGKKNRIERYTWHSDCTIIFVHHLHYFCYVYFIVCRLVYYADTHSLWPCGGVLFAAGWIFYVVVPKINIATSPYYNFMIGHFIVSFLLVVGGWYSEQPNVVIACWILASPFAGTILTVDTLLAKKQGRKTIRYAEAIGHVVGTIVGIVTFYVVKDIQYVMYCAACMAGYNALQIKKYIG